MKSLTLTVIIFSVTLFSCQCQKQVANNKEKITTTTEQPITTKETVFDITISFISKASGIDNTLKAKIDASISDFNKKHSTNVKPEIVGWGREGELDYLFLTKNLSTKQNSDLIKRFKVAIGSSDMAHIKIDKKSVHKR